MQVKSIMLPKNKMVLLAPTETVREAVEKIEKGNFLSLPIIADGKFDGFLSKQFVYDKFFSENKSGKVDLDAFLSKNVSEMIFDSAKLESISMDAPIEIAAKRISEERLRFLPVKDADGDFVGIVTQRALFDVIVKAFGLNDPKVSIITDSISGVLQRAAEIIAKCGGNITNIIQLDTDVPNVQEIIIRIKGADIMEVREKLVEKGFRIR